MKRLKFMLAAAAAIGLTSASQATDYNGSTDFEAFTVGATADSTMSSYFDFAGASGDNESTIVGESVNFAGNRPAQFRNSADTKYLKVSTGTDPLLCKINNAPETIDEGGSIYVDTLVQFTATPATDEVVANAGDKLMIYVQNVTNNLGEVSGTNLMVKAADYTKADDLMGIPESLTTNDIILVSNFDITKWYRLTVESFVAGGLLQFHIYLDGDQLQSPDNLHGADVKAFPSLLGTSNTQLAGVGFAGEGAVDELSFTTDAFPTALDFTLVWPAGFTPVGYTIGSATLVPIGGTDTSPLHIAPIAGDTVRFSFQNADGVAKVMELVAASDATSIDASTATFTWADYLGDAVSGAYTIDDSNDLVMLQKGVFSGLATANETFKQTANIDMTGVANFYGIGWFESSTSFASVPTGVASDGKTTLPFAGTYDGQGYTISNVTIMKHSYAGVFNNVSGTVRNLTVQDIGLSGTCSEWGCAIVGNASAGSLLENLTAVTSAGFNWGSSANHNVAGIVVRPIGAATIRGCVNNANISSVSKRLGGIASFVGSGSTGTVFDSCTNNAALVSTDGTRGVGGILGCAEGNTTETATYIRNCCDWGTETAQASGGHAGAIVGSNWNGSYTYTDDGGNTFAASTGDCGYIKNPIFGRAYAIDAGIDGANYLTTVKAADLAAGNTYVLLTDIAASETPVFTLQAAGDTIAFDANGHTFAGTVDGAAAVGVSSATAGTVTTYTAFTAVAKNGANKYATFKAAVDAANAGDTVVVLADCAVPASVSFTKNITVSNDYTIAANVNYALCIGATVTFEGSGMIQRGSTISGSAFCVGANETTRGTITAGTAGTLIFNGGTVCGGNGGNQIKLENGTVTMNGGVLKDGLRGIKADADAGSYTSAIVINGGTITNFTAYAVFASAESATGKATITINGGVIAGPVGKAGKGDETITIPGTSTAKFNADQSAFCESGYETTLSDGWYVVTAVQQAGWVDDPATVSNMTAAAAYPVLADTALATADAQKLTVWAKANSVDFSAATTTPADYVEAFLLNCAATPAAVAEEKEEFVLDISVAADGTVTVSLPDGKEYNGTLQMKGSNDLSTWTNVEGASSSYKFYKYELSL